MSNGPLNSFKNWLGWRSLTIPTCSFSSCSSRNLLKNVKLSIQLNVHLWSFYSYIENCLKNIVLFAFCRFEILRMLYEGLSKSDGLPSRSTFVLILYFLVVENNVRNKRSSRQLWGMRRNKHSVRNGRRGECPLDPRSGSFFLKWSKNYGLTVDWPLVIWLNFLILDA